MHESDALAKIQEIGKRGRFVECGHCLDRMEERNISHNDIRHALANATQIRTSDADHQSDWTVRGPDTEGDIIILGVLLNAVPPGWIEVVSLHADNPKNNKSWWP